MEQKTEQALRLLEQIKANQDKALELQQEYLMLYRDQHAKAEANLDRAEGVTAGAERMQKVALRASKIIIPLIIIALIGLLILTFIR